MKRLVLVVVAMLSMTMGFADTENVANVNNVNAYDMKVDMRKLGEVLGLTLDQIESVADVHHTFCGEMMIAAQASEDDRQELVEKAVGKELKYMKYILTPVQFNKYELLLNATLTNRGFNK